MSRTATFTPEQDAELLRLNAAGVSIRMLARLRRETPSAVQRAIGRERKRIEQTEHEQKTAAAAKALMSMPMIPDHVVPDGDAVVGGEIHVHFPHDFPHAPDDDAAPSGLVTTSVDVPRPRETNTV
jgi:hypothetical protein